ncbi:MAG TPA: nucleotidyltransferase domain-containing protein [Candidatus Nanoarchaeia archaeon]|nr:nucleotidyltransferase domain-containing protein [Candidatus Woesearchaeota archaeon]HLC20088.1 nucleotidyltransferase domain-containing protein [Candidatus Nanoarchaeia archaeon]
MYKELSILSIFFEDPVQQFHIREVARLAKINHMTARSYLNRFVKDGLLARTESKPFTAYRARQQERKWLNLRLYYNLEKLRESHIIEDMERFYDYPTIVLFGSYAHATDVKESDIDMCIITPVKKEFSTDKYDKMLKKRISIHLFTPKKISDMKKTNQELVNSICNGMVLSGQLEIIE